MLKRVSIQNFKSLKDVTLDLQKVNLLIGPNNSGKTNFLKALEFLSRWISNKDINSLEVKEFANKSLPQQVISFVLTEDALNEEKSYVQTYRLQINSNLFGINYDEEIYDNINKRNEVRYSQTYQPPGYFVVENQIIEDGKPLPSRFLSHRAEVCDTFAVSIFETFVDSVVYKPDPNKITKPGLVGAGKETVDADASNLVGFLDLMLGKYRRQVFNRTEADLHTCIPEFDEINLEDAPPTEELKKQYGDKSFKRIGLTNSKQGITYWADELSEGTLYFLALLCIINQPNPPKLLLLEEPEKGIHPRRIQEVMDFIFRLAEEKDVQIILTTHNEHVLDDFSTRPESVFVFDKDDEGATYVRNLQRDIIEPTNERNRELGLDEIDLTTNLSENWLYGLLGGVPSIP